MLVYILVLDSYSIVSNLLLNSNIWFDFASVVQLGLSELSLLAVGRVHGAQEQAWEGQG